MSADSETSPAQKTVLPRKGRLPLIVRLLRAAAIAYLFVCLLLLIGQEYAVFPGSLMPLPRGENTFPASEPISLTLPDGTKLAGLFCHSTGAHPRGKPPTILYFYGNGSQVAHSRAEIDLFRECGAQVMLIDYPGYGASGGRPSEAALYRAADALWDFAAGHPEVDERQIVLVGWSLGGAVAIDLAARRPAAALLTVSTFTSMDEMAHRRLPIFPTSLVLRHHFTNIPKLASLRLPVLIAHGDRDSIVPFSMSRTLCESATQTPVRHLPLPGADHNDAFLTGRDELEPALRELLTIAHARTLSSASPEAKP